MDDPFTIKSYDELVSAVAEGMTVGYGEVTPYLDLTDQKLQMLPEDIEEDGDEMINNLFGEAPEEIKRILAHQLIEIDHLSSRRSFGLMENFAVEHDNPRLLKALRARHPFSAFRYAVETEGLLKEWYAAKNAFEEEMAKEWLGDNLIEFVDGKIVQRETEE